MIWNIAICIWFKGAGIFGTCCIPFLEPGLAAFSAGVLMSWMAVPVYAMSLWMIKKAGIPHKRFTVLILLVPTASAILAALCFLQVVDTGMVSDSESILFWVPPFCCILSLTFSANRIYYFLHSETVPSKSFPIKFYS
jgi:hypothetical protein